MARIANTQLRTARRNQILDTALKLVYTKGYEQMSIRDILDELQISSGAFHHYFDSREVLLAALIDRIQERTEEALLPLIDNPHLSAIEKLQGFFDLLNDLRDAQKSSIVRLLRIWYTDDNRTIRHMVDEAMLKQRAPLLAKIVRQGVGERIFTNAYPDQAGEVIIFLLQSMGDTHAKLLLSPAQSEHDTQRHIEHIVTTYAAYMDAIERVLGMPAHSLRRTDAEAVSLWVAALHQD